MSLYDKHLCEMHNIFNWNFFLKLRIISPERKEITVIMDNHSFFKIFNSNTSDCMSIMKNIREFPINVNDSLYIQIYNEQINFDKVDFIKFKNIRKVKKYYVGTNNRIIICDNTSYLYSTIAFFIDKNIPVYFDKYIYISGLRKINYELDKLDEYGQPIK